MKKNLVITFLLFVPFICFSQKSLEFTAGFGFTVVDVESLVEKDEITNTIAEDWGQFSTGFSGQFFFASIGNIGFGAEFMSHSLFWYSVRIPYVPSPIYREYSVSATRITPIIRFGVDNQFALDIGPEFNFSDGMSLGLLISGNYYIPVNDKIDIPLKARLDIMNLTVLTVPVTLNAGIRIKLGY